MDHLMEEAFFEGFRAFVWARRRLGPQPHMSPNERWAWDLGFRLHEHLIANHSEK